MYSKSSKSPPDGDGTIVGPSSDAMKDLSPPPPAQGRSLHHRDGHLVMLLALEAGKGG